MKLIVKLKCDVAHYVIPPIQPSIEKRLLFINGDAAAKPAVYLSLLRHLCHKWHGH